MFRATRAITLTQYMIATCASPGSIEFNGLRDDGAITRPDDEVDGSGDGEREEE